MSQTARFQQTLVAKARTHDSMKAQSKLTTVVDGRRRIISDPSLMIRPVEEIFAGEQATALHKQIREVLGKYRRTLQSDRKHLLEQFTMLQVARKVVGVGSVGTRCWIVLIEGADYTEPLFLQPKQAEASVLARYCGRQPVRQSGRAGGQVADGERHRGAVKDVSAGMNPANHPRLDEAVRDCRRDDGPVTTPPRPMAQLRSRSYMGLLMPAAIFGCRCPLRPTSSWPW